MIKRTELSSTTGQWTKAKTETDKAPRTDEGAKLVLTETEPPRRGPRTGQGCDTCKWHLCKAGSFSYGESPRTPPLEGTSLHRRNNSVERPWGILSLFTTCLPLRVKSRCQRLWPTCELIPHLKPAHIVCPNNENNTSKDVMQHNYS